MGAAGLAVPPGAVLTTSFFVPWFEDLQTSASWAELTSALPDEWVPLCDPIKEQSATLPWTPGQKRTLTALRDHLDDEALFAVCSSSPEEDLESASFAGGDEIRLGVPLADLEEAIRHCFASSFDERVLVYKREHDLHPSLRTEPGERRRLYADSGLAKGAALNAPISPMGQAAIEALGAHVAEWFVGPLSLNREDEESLLLTAPGRGYQNLSALLSIVSAERFAKGFEETDSRIVEILRTVDADRYRLPERPSWARLRPVLSLLPRLVWRAVQMLVSMLWILLAPDRASTAYRQSVDAFEARLTGELDWDLPLGEFWRRYLGPSVRHFLEVTGPAFGASFLAMQGLDRVVGSVSGAEALTDKLKRGFRGNVVTKMGIALHRVAQHLEPADFDDLEAAAEEPSLHLQARCDERMHFVRRLEEQVTSFPPVIDSCGRIPRPPSPETGEGGQGGRLARRSHRTGVGAPRRRREIGRKGRRVGGRDDRSGLDAAVRQRSSSGAGGGWGLAARGRRRSGVRKAVRGGPRPRNEPT